ncbi:class IV adenylate cyclase [Candidatus Woesearchaeota archaeon]|nr:class IV adenylate cyclase [Candidatus Woesearchaeota archaeon]
MKETETKFQLQDPGAMRQKLLSIGFKSKGRHLQVNRKFNDKDDNFGPHKGRLLRIRVADKCTLTSKAGKSVEKNIKTLDEYETEISDPEKTEKILNMLGFHLDEVMEKYREAFQKRDVEVVIDEVPFLGAWMEIEGDHESIERTAEELGLDMKDAISSSYGTLWRGYKEKHKIDIRDCTFGENHGQRLL